MSSASTKSAAAPATGGVNATHASSNRAAAQRRTRIEDANAHEEHDGGYRHDVKSQDAVAHDAVMQLAKAAAHDEANHGQLQPTAPANVAASPKKRRKISSTSGSEGFANPTALPATVADEGASGHEAPPSTAATTEPPAYDFHNQNLNNLFALSESSAANGEAAKGEQADTSAAVLSDAGGDATTDSQNPGDGSEAGTGNPLVARNGRQLNASKRAAQNRAAQRAFRARRDEYVRQVEDKAKQFDDLAAAAAMYKQRYEEARHTVDLLRDHNYALRAAVEGAGASVPRPPLGLEEAVEQLLAAAAELDAKTAAAAAAEHEKSESSDLNSLSAAAAAAAASAAASEPALRKPEGAAT